MSYLDRFGVFTLTQELKVSFLDCQILSQQAGQDFGNWINNFFGELLALKIAQK